MDDQMVEQIPLKVNETRSIEELFQEVKSYDLVLTVDAPLADALNARLERPRLGHFATTPRRLALNELSPDKKIFREKSELFLKIIDETDIDWKRAIYLLEDILNSWKETGDPTNAFNERENNEKDIENILKVLKNTINPFTAVERYTIPERKKVAVISEYQFSNLDKKVLPEEYSKIEVFKNSDTELSSFHIYNSTTEIVEAVLTQIKKLDPKDVAIVMEKESQYRYLIESLLRSNDIPYMVSEDLIENETFRKFLNMIKVSFSRSGLRVEDVKPLIDQKDPIDPKTEEYLLKHHDGKQVDGIKKLLKKIPDLTFEELLREEMFKEDKYLIREHLRNIGVLEEKITPERYNSLLLYIESFDIEIKSARQGVLIASPNTSTFIDRPYVFYLGMGTSWTPEPPAHPWIDKERFDEQKKKDFEILLQNGEQQYYMVKNSEMGQKIVPSFYLNEFCKEEINSFEDLKHEWNKKMIESSILNFEKEDIDTDPQPTKTISQSTLNRLAFCPKDQFFSELIDKPDKIYFRSGRVFHDFAEFYMNHPNKCKDLDPLVQSVVEELKPFLEEHQLSEVKTRIKIGMENIVSFLDDYEVKIKSPRGYEKKYTENIFSELLDEPITTENTEVSFYNEEIGAKGKVDLILDEDHIVDHKSGKKKSIYKIMKQSDIEDIEKRPDFQAKMYLTHHRQYHDGDPIRFTYYHLLGNLRDVLSGEDNFSDNEVTVKYFPKNFNEIVQGKELYDWLKSSKTRKKVLNKLGYDQYRDFFEKKTIDETEKKEILESKATIEFIRFCKEKIGSYKYVEKACKSIMKKLIEFKKTNYFKQDLDRFEEFLEKNIEDYNHFRTSDFPVGDADLEKIENKDLVIPKEGGR